MLSLCLLNKINFQSKYQTPHAFCASYSIVALQCEKQLTPSPHGDEGTVLIHFMCQTQKYWELALWCSELICHLQRQYAVLECRFESCCLLQLPAIIPGKAVEDCPTAWAPALPCPRPACCSLGSEPKVEVLFSLISVLPFRWMNTNIYIFVPGLGLGFILRACHCLLIPVLSQLEKKEIGKSFMCYIIIHNFPF